MDQAKTWTVEIFIDEHDGHTHARAELHAKDTVLTGEGVARRNPADQEVPEIGDELAAARALSHLAHELFDATVGDIEAITHHTAVVAR